MKGNPMKEKVIFTLSLACFIGIMWLSSITQTINVKPVFSDKLTTPHQASNIIEYIDDVPPKTTDVDDVTPESDYSAVEACSLKPIETDIFTFGDAFQHYRQCLGSDSSFHWKGSIYTTLFSDEVIIQVADSVQVEEKAAKNNQVSETH